MSNSKQSQTKSNRLPGDLTKDRYIEQLIRVNHAGEYGAKQIYKGQLAVIKDKKDRDVIAHMAEQEEEHLQYFSDALVQRKMRPSALMPLWHAGGFLLGAGTALLGTKAAMACTVAVEEVIDEHYQEQLEELKEDEQPLKDAITKFQAEELEHRDTGLAHHAEEATGYPVLSAVIKHMSKTAIWLAKRV